MRSRTGVVGTAAYRHVRLIVVTTIILTTMGAAFALTRSASYSSSAAILLKPAVGNAFSSDSTSSSQQVTIAVTTEAALANSTAVLDLANEGLPEDKKVGAAQVTATVPTTSQVIEIQVRGKSPEASQQGAEAIAEALLEYRREQASSALESRLGSLDAQQKTARQNLAEATRTGGPDARQLIALYTEQLSSIDSARNSLLQSETSPGDVIRPAQEPGSPTGIQPILFALLGALLGLGLGLVLAIWRDRSDDRVRLESPAVAGRPVLVRLPDSATRERLTAHTHDDRLVVGFREFRAAVLATAPLPTSLLVTSSDGREDAPMIGTSLAFSLSQADYRVAIVFTAPLPAIDLDRTVTKPGLVQVLETGVPVAQALDRVDGLSVLPFSRAHDTELRPDLFARAAFASAISDLTKSYDYVIVVADSLERTGVVDIAMATDSLVLTCSADESRESVVTRAVQHANELGAEFIGAAIVAPEPRRRRVAQEDGGEPNSVPPTDLDTGAGAAGAVADGNPQEEAKAKDASAARGKRRSRRSDTPDSMRSPR